LIGTTESPAIGNGIFALQKIDSTPKKVYNGEHIVGIAVALALAKVNPSTAKLPNF
jgi:hypothetical protein